MPLSATMSIDGISNDHTEAATITPEANPNKAFCTRGERPSFIINTNAEPNIVPSKGISKPIISVSILQDLWRKDTTFF